MERRKAARYDVTCIEYRAADCESESEDIALSVFGVLLTIVHRLSLGVHSLFGACRFLSECKIVLWRQIE